MPPSDSTLDQRFARLLHHRGQVLEPGDSLSLPLISSSVFHLPGEPSAPFTYGRPDTPVWQAVEHQLGILDDARIVLFPSGMSAISSVFYSLLGRGQVVLLPTDGYYMTRQLIEEFLAPFDIECRLCPTRELLSCDLSDVDLVFLESPSNPRLDVVDIAAVAARARACNTQLVVDNTTCTAALQQPLDLGADIVVCSDTKAAGGHSDLLMGHVAGRNDAVMARIRQWRTAAGAIPGPFEAWLLHRGLETLDVRMQRMCDNALALAHRLSEHPRVHDLRYPGLPTDPSHAMAQQQMRRFGSLIGFTLDDAEHAERFIDQCPVLMASTSFGGVHSSAERRARWGDAVPAGFVRLSVGCEPFEVLCEGVIQALDALDALSG